MLVTWHDSKAFYIIFTSVQKHRAYLCEEVLQAPRQPVAPTPNVHWVHRGEHVHSGHVHTLVGARDEERHAAAAWTAV